MKITDISIQAKNDSRVNISVDGKYRFSLDLYQVSELGIKRGNEYSESDLVNFETESQFGKLYARALEYCLMRPHSLKEIRDYLWRKTRQTRVRDKRTGEIKTKDGVSAENADRVFNRLVEKGYANDESFARFWVNSRNQSKGISKRKLEAELRSKGVERSIIARVLNNSDRVESDELNKVIAKKRGRYPDDQKFMQYLMRQGFRYDDIREALNRDD